MGERRSGCPIAFALDVLGDRWSLLVLRDVIFERKTRFREFAESAEGIASNVLAERLERLVQVGLLAKQPDGEDGRRFVYSPTEKGLDLVPTMLEIVRWSAAHDSQTAAPPEFLRELEQDREGLIRRVRARFEYAPRTEVASSTQQPKPDAAAAARPRSFRSGARREVPRRR
jgi:DNA-binding HxlR family transcriptional regulator